MSIAANPTLFVQVQTFLTRVINSLYISPVATNVGFMLYNNNQAASIGLSSDPAAIRLTIDTLSATNLFSTAIVVSSQLFVQGRPTAPDVAVVITNNVTPDILGITNNLRIFGMTVLAVSADATIDADFEGFVADPRLIFSLSLRTSLINTILAFSGPSCGGMKHKLSATSLLSLVLCVLDIQVDIYFPIMQNYSKIQIQKAAI